MQQQLAGSLQQGPLRQEQSGCSICMLQACSRIHNSTRFRPRSRYPPMSWPDTLCACTACRAAVECLSSQLDPRELTHLVITHVGPNRTPTIAAVLRAALMGRPAGSKLKLVASNPAIKVLRSGLQGESTGSGGMLLAGARCGAC